MASSRHRGSDDVRLSTLLAMAWPHREKARYTGRAVGEYMGRNPALVATEAMCEIVWPHWDHSSAMMVSGLALALPRLQVHELRHPVPEVLAETDLHDLPPEPPALLRTAVALEVSDPRHQTICAPCHLHDANWERTVALGAFEFDGAWQLVGVGDPDGLVLAQWRPRWGEGDLASSVDELSLVDDVVGDTPHMREWARDAARSLLVLGLLLEAAGSPLRVADEGPRLAGKKHGAHRPGRSWSVRRIYLDPQPGPNAGAARGSAVSEADCDGRELAGVRVRGHLRRQPCGPAAQDRRWIYVAEHAARRWVAPRTRTIISKSSQRVS
jgi:hypothetical protein